MLADFRKFIARGNVLDLAVAVIVGAAFGDITTSLTEDVIMPVIGALVGDIDFSNLFVRLGPVPQGYTGSLANYAQLKEAGVPMLGWGAFATTVINFLILAFIIFLLVRWANRLIGREEEKAGPTEVALLTDIRDELRRRPPG